MIYWAAPTDCCMPCRGWPVPVPLKSLLYETQLASQRGEAGRRVSSQLPFDSIIFSARSRTLKGVSSGPLCQVGPFPKSTTGRAGPARNPVTQMAYEERKPINGKTFVSDDVVDLMTLRRWALDENWVWAFGGHEILLYNIIRKF